MKNFPWRYKGLNRFLVRKALPGVENYSAILEHLGNKHVLKEGESSLLRHDVRISGDDVQIFFIKDIALRKSAVLLL